MNPATKAIILICILVLLGLFLFPSWYETNGQYVKQLGHHFLFKSPEAVPVDCYFVECVTAPASYFRVVLDRRPWFESLSTVTVVASILLLLFKKRADGSFPSMRHSTTRWAFSGLVALALPVSASPMELVGIYGISVPMYLFSGEDNSLWYGIFFPVVFSVYAVAVYLLSTAAVWISARIGSQHPAS